MGKALARADIGQNPVAQGIGGAAQKTAQHHEVDLDQLTDTAIGRRDDARDLDDGGDRCADPAVFDGQRGTGDS